MKTLRREIDELIEIRDLKNSETFQNFIAKPLYKEVEKLKHAYEAKTIEELATLKGRYQGLMFLIKLLKQIDEDLKHKLSLKSDEE